ncbi:MAG: hypothetical protein ACXVH3_27750, partial [Solirubrobacteraceae bacterium]
MQRDRRDLGSAEDERHGDGDADETESNQDAPRCVLSHRESRRSEAPRAQDQGHDGKNGDLGGR